MNGLRLIQHLGIVQICVCNCKSLWMSDLPVNLRVESDEVPSLCVGHAAAHPSMQSDSTYLDIGSLHFCVKLLP